MAWPKCVWTACWGWMMRLKAEAEHGDCLLWIGPAQTMEFALPEPLLTGLAQLRAGRCAQSSVTRLSPLARAAARTWAMPCTGTSSRRLERRCCWCSRNDNPGLPLRPILHRRRSAQSMDGRSGIQAALLLAWLRRLMPVQSPVPFAVSGEPSEIDLLLFVHRVQGLAPGLYWLDRTGSGVRHYARITCGSGWTRS